MRARAGYAKTGPWLVSTGLVVGLTISVAACGRDGPRAGAVGEGGGAGADRGLPDRAAILDALARGYFPGRVGDLVVISTPDAIITYPGDGEQFMHGGPWDHDTRIPLLMYGPGVFRDVELGGTASHQDIGATMARVLGLWPLPNSTGAPLTNALEPRDEPPGLVALLVLDALRPDLLDRFADALPNLRGLMARGARVPGARVNYLPTNTSTAHTTMGTGTDPSIHGIVGNVLFDRAAGTSTLAYPEASPMRLMTLTVADRWAFATGGRAVIAAQAGTDYPSAALAGRGACVLNGYRPAVAYYDRSTGGWSTDETCYRLPLALAESNIDGLLEENGRAWLGHELPSFSEARRSSFFTQFELESALRILESEPFGEDEIADLFLANFKSTDYVSHKYGPFSSEMEATLVELDARLARLVETLETKAGPRGLALFITADHGMPDEPPEASLRVRYPEVTALVNDRFDPDGPGVVSFFGSSENQMYLARERLETLGLTVRDVADYLETLPFVHLAITEDEVRAHIAAGDTG